MSGYDNDTRTKREKRIQERAATKAEKKRKKAINKARKKGLEVDEKNHIIDNTKTP